MHSKYARLPVLCLRACNVRCKNTLLSNSVGSVVHSLYRISQPGYVPTKSDILNTRWTTSKSTIFLSQHSRKEYLVCKKGDTADDNLNVWQKAVETYCNSQVTVFCFNPCAYGETNEDCNEEVEDCSSDCIGCCDYPGSSRNLFWSIMQTLQPNQAHVLFVFTHMYQLEQALSRKSMRRAFPSFSGDDLSVENVLLWWRGVFLELCAENCSIPVHFVYTSLTSDPAEPGRKVFEGCDQIFDENSSRAAPKKS